MNLAVEQLESKQVVELGNEERVRLITNAMTVLVGESVRDPG